VTDYLPFRILCAMATEVLETQTGIEDLGDYRERVKQLAARRQRPYGPPDLLRSALDAALAAHLKKNPGFQFAGDRAPAALEPAPERPDPTLIRRTPGARGTHTVASLVAGLAHVMEGR
jgi:hypothetical protein